ncbi:Ank 4 domain containing protein, partial [Asbolus verrucosus]
MSSSEDAYEYECYELDSYRELEGPPLVTKLTKPNLKITITFQIKKRSRLLMTVVQNDVETLRELLDSPKWYKVKDKYGYGLLHIAVLRENKEVFDYLLSIKDFPLEAVDNNMTALVIALSGFVSNDIFMNPLIRDHKGFTALDMVIQLRNDKLMPVKENLLYYTLDQYTQYTITADNLLMVAESPFFYQIVDHVAKVDFHSSTDDHCFALFKMKPEYLRVLIEKFDYVIKQIFLNYSEYYYFGDFKLISIENFNILEESKLKLEMISFLSNFNNSSFITNIIESGRSESVITELVCYLLSYGMRIDEKHFEMIFQKFGYCELFKILLHMDIETQMEQRKISNIMPRLIYDIHFDIQQIIEDPF